MVKDHIIYFKGLLSIFDDYIEILNWFDYLFCLYHLYLITIPFNLDLVTACKLPSKVPLHKICVEMTCSQIKTQFEKAFLY